MTQELALRPRPAFTAEAKFENRDTFGPLRPRRQYDGSLVHEVMASLATPGGPVRELAIMHAAGAHMEVLGGASIKGKNVALAVAEHGHHGGWPAAVWPASAVATQRWDSLSDKVAQVVRRSAATPRGSYLTTQQGRGNCRSRRPFCQHRVQQHRGRYHLPISPSPPAFRRGCEVDFTGVLDRQYGGLLPPCRRAFAQFSITRAVVTLALQKRLKRTSRARLPLPAAAGMLNILANNNTFEQCRPRTETTIPEPTQ